MANAAWWSWHGRTKGLPFEAAFGEKSGHGRPWWSVHGRMAFLIDQLKRAAITDDRIKMVG
jgi:hypothetical protein